MKRNDQCPVKLPDIKLPECRHCESFQLHNISTYRIMAVCNARNVVLDPEFPAELVSKRVFLSKSTLPVAVFKPFDTCPKLEELRNKRLIPWAILTYDFSK